MNELSNEIEDERPLSQQGSLVQLFVTTTMLTVGMLILAALNDNTPSSFWAVLAGAGFVAFLLQMISSAPATFIILLPLLFLKATEIASSIAIESGALMQEIQQIGYPTGGTARLVIVVMVFFTVGAIFIESAWAQHSAFPDRSRLETAASQLSPWVTLSCIFFFGYFIYVGLRVGFPILSGAERLDFKYQLSDPIYISLLGNRTLFVTALSLMTIAPDSRRRAWILFFGIFLISILFGEKFTSLMVMSAIFPVAGLLDYLSQYRKLPITRIAGAGAVLGMITIGACLNVYYYVYNDFETAKTKLLDRMAIQGEMWYVGDRDFRYNSSIDWHTIREDISACIGRRSQDPDAISTDFGPFFVMQNYADKYVMENGQKKGIYFAFTYSTYWLMVSGYFGHTIVLLLTSLVYAIAGRCFLNALVTGNALGMLLAQKAMYMVTTAIITGFTFFALGYKTIGLIIASWIVLNWRSYWHVVTGRPRSEIEI